MYLSIAFNVQRMVINSVQRASKTFTTLQGTVDSKNGPRTYWPGQGLGTVSNSWTSIEFCYVRRGYSGKYLALPPN